MQFRLPNFWQSMHDAAMVSTGDPLGRSPVVTGCAWLGRLATVSMVRTVLVVGCTLLLGCGQSPSEVGTPITGGGQAAAGALPRIVVTCRPLLEITRELAGDSATVDAVLPDDAEASGGWMPDPAAIAVLQSADAVVLNGAGYEPWLPQITLPASGIVDCSSGFSDQLIRVADAVTHQHGPKGAASGHQVVSSVWLDPELLRVQVAQIQDCLVRECPEDSADISARATRLTDELAAVEDQLKHVGEELHQAQAAVYVDHQRLLYLIRPLGLESAVVSLPAEQAELQEVLSRLQKSVPEGGIAVLLISGGNTAELRSQLQDHAVAASVRLVEIDDCLTPSAGDGSLLRRMAENLDRLEKSLLPD